MPRGGRGGPGHPPPPDRSGNQDRAKNAQAAQHMNGGNHVNNAADYGHHDTSYNPRVEQQYQDGYGQSSTNGYHLPNNQPGAAASPLDLLMSAIAASAGGGIQAGQNVTNMGNNAQTFGLDPVNHVQMMGISGLGGLGSGTPMNGGASALPNQPTSAPFGNHQATATSLDQIFGHNAFSAAASVASSADTNTSLPTPFQVSLLMNLLSSQNGNIGNVQMPQPPQATQPFNQSNGNGVPRQQPQMPSTPQQTRSGRISRPPAQPMPLFPDWSQIPGLLNQQNSSSDTNGNAAFPSQAALRAIQVLQQPGMEAVRQALASTGWLGQLSGEQGRAGSSMANYPGPTVSYQQDGSDGNGLQQAGYGNDPSSNGNKRRKRNPDADADRDDYTASGANSRPATFEPITYDDADEDDVNQSDIPTAPPFPRPLTGKGSRSAWTKEELRLRRKERNKQSASRYRAKRESQMEELQNKLEGKEEEVKAMQEKCDRLEQDLRNYILSSGLSLPGSTCQTPTLPHSQGMQTTLVRASSDHGTAPLPDLHMQQTPLAAQGPMTSQSSNTPTTMAPQNDGVINPASGFGGAGLTPFGTSNTFNNAMTTSALSGQAAFDASADQLFDFNLFMNFDGLDDDDDDFQPETSPHNASESESESDDEDDDGTPPASALGSKRKKGTKKSRAGRHAGEAGVTPIYTDTEATPRDRDDEDYVDPEMEDEDLFLPIEDVPIPPETLAAGSRSGGAGGEAAAGSMNDLTRDLMAALNVETRDQLAVVMRTLVDSAGDGVGEDVREKLKSVMYLAQANGDSSQARHHGTGAADGQSASS